MDITTEDGAGAGGNVAEEQLTGLALLNSQLGLSTEVDSIMPPPLDHTASDGMDSLGQPIIDGSTNDYSADVPGLEEYAVIMNDTIDPLDTEALNAVDEDLENSMKIVDNASAASASLSEHIAAIKDQGGISQGDLDEAIGIHPGMEDHVRSIYASTPKLLTKTNYAAGLEALTTGEKVLAGGVIAAILAIFVKLVLVVLRVMKSRAAMSATKYAKALRTPDDMRRYQEAIDHQIQEIVGRVKDHQKFGLALGKLVKAKTNYAFDANHILKSGGGVCEALFAQAIRNKYFTLYEIVAGRAVSGINGDKLKELLTHTPKILSDYAAALNIKLSLFIKEFNEDKVLDVKEFIVDDKAYSYSNITTADKSTGMARQLQLIKNLTVRIDEPKISKMGDYMRVIVDLSDAVAVGESVVPPQQDALKKVQQLQALVQALKTSGRADIRDNRSAIMKQLQLQEASFAHTCTSFESAVAAYVDLLALSQSIMDDTVKMYQHAFKLSENDD